MGFLGIKWRKVFSMHTLKRAIPELSTLELEDILRALAEEVRKRQQAAGGLSSWTDSSGYTFTISKYEPPRED